MSQSENIHRRIASVMEEVTYIQKEAKKGMQYTIVSHDKVTAKVRPALLKHGVIYYPTRCEHSQNGNRAECSMTVRFVNIDDPQDFIDVQTFGYGVDGQDKGPGKAMSYAVKYALLKCLGLETGDDTDHDSIDHSSADPALAQQFIEMIEGAETLQSLQQVWSADPSRQRLPGAEAAKDRRKSELMSAQKEAA